MKLQVSDFACRDEWKNAEISLPGYDIMEMRRKTAAAPVWVHVGAGNIFRGYIAALQDKLLDDGLAQCGIVALDSSDGDQITKIYRPYDNLTLLVTLFADGSMKKSVIASVAEAWHADWNNGESLERMKEIFRAKSLQMCSFTITEKGYGIRNGQGELLPDVAADIAAGPAHVVNVMSKAAALLLERFENGAAPIAMVSMDNCSHNGEKLAQSILTIAEGWVNNGSAPAEFLAYLKNPKCVAFPWTMIDKITPRPNTAIADSLEALGLEAMQPISRARGAAVAPFVNAESAEYLVIEDLFPNGRPALEKAGVYMTDRETVNRTERMKVTTCLNPLHTALAVTGCLLGYDRIYKEMQDASLRNMATCIGRHDGMPVVTDPGILSPETFLDEVLVQRLPNPYIPDMPQRIACDTSAKIPVRFGETIKSYLSSGRPLSDLKAIPFAIAAWLRYLLGIDDSGKPFDIPADPRVPELQAKLDGIVFGNPDNNLAKADAILADASIFGVDLTNTDLAPRIRAYFGRMLAAPGAVRALLDELFLND